MARSCRVKPPDAPVGRDPVAAEALRQAARLELRAETFGDEDDMRAATLMRVLYGLCQANRIGRTPPARQRAYRALADRH
jgi:hypothetical protein